jgi:hypothetical protein
MAESYPETPPLAPTAARVPAPTAADWDDFLGFCKATGQVMPAAASTGPPTWPARPRATAAPRHHPGA